MNRSSQMEQRRHDYLDDLCAQVIDVLRDLNIDDQKADIAGAEVTARMVQNWGGQQLYIPKDYSHKSNERALVIYDACNGRNFPEVARQFDISLRSVYRIYNRTHAQMVSKKQPDMFHRG